MSLIEKCRMWQMGALVAAFWGSDREGLPSCGSPPRFYCFLGLGGRTYHRIWWRCDCSTHWQEGTAWEWDPITRCFLAELFCYTQRKHSWKREPANITVWFVGMWSYVHAVHLAERSTAGCSWVRPERSCFCWRQARSLLPVVSVSCSARDLEGLGAYLI